MHTRPRLATLFLALLGASMIACDDSSTGPDLFDDLEQAPLAMDADLAISVDSELAASALATARGALGPNRPATVRARLAAAEDHFDNARRRWAANDDEGARREGRNARTAIADAMLEGWGSGIVDVMIEETDAQVATMEETETGYADASLSATLSSLVAQARTARDTGSYQDAGERMVAARQHTDRAARDHDRDRHRDRDTDRARDRDHDGARDGLTHGDLARLQVAQGAAAIRLAWGLIGGSPTEAQARLMETAEELQARAETALQEGNLSTAASLAHSAEIKALVAVVAADGLSHSDVQSVAALAGQLLEEARTVVAAGGSAVDKAILKIAVRLYEKGSAKLAAGNVRSGMTLLWHSATMSAVLIDG